MSADRALRDRLEHAQARLRRARLELDQPLDIEDEARPLREEVTQLASTLEDLQHRLHTESAELEGRKMALWGTRRARASRQLQSAGQRAASMLLGVVGSFLGVLAGFVVFQIHHDTTITGLVALVLASAALWRLGKS